MNDKIERIKINRDIEDLEYMLRMRRYRKEMESDNRMASLQFRGAGQDVNAAPGMLGQASSCTAFGQAASSRCRELQMIKNHNLSVLIEVSSRCNQK